MGITIYWSVFAKKELQGIFDYYYKNASLQVAERLIFEIVSSVQILQNQPEVGPKEELLFNSNRKYYYLVHKNYKIIYWFDSKEKFIGIADVFDTRQNPVKIKRNTSPHFSAAK